MVKFSPGSELIDRIAYKLQGMLKDGIEEAGEETSEPYIEMMAALHLDSQRALVFGNHVDPDLDSDFWDIHCKYILLFYI